MKKVLSLVIALAMLLALVPAAAMAADEGTDSSLIAYLSFDEGVKAEVGGVKINGTVSTGEGIRGNAAYIPSGTGNYLNILGADGGNDLLVGKNEVTITFFENRESGSWPLFIAPNTNAQDYLKYENYIGLFDGAAFRLERYLGIRTDDTSSTVSASSVSGWKHIAIVLTDSYSELYVNGVSVGKADSKSTIADLLTAESYFQIGRGNWGDSGEDFVGYIDELRVYDRVLSEDEISALTKYATPIEKIKEAIDIADKDNITGDIDLITKYLGATIEWTSSNTDVITNDGKVTRGIEDVTVTLTAVITNDVGETGTVTYELTVKALFNDILDAIEIHNTDNILDSVTLLDEVDGVKITWTSSNPDVVSDKPVPNGDYEFTPGYVTRGDEDEEVTLTAEFEYAGKTYTKEYNLTVKAVKPEEEKVAYLYAYFRGNVNGSAEVQQIHFATSEDGYNWTDLNGNWPILTSSMGTKNLRDPYIIRSRYGDKFYVLATDLDTQDGQGWGPWSLAGSKYLMVWESEDLVNWSEQRMVKFANDDIGCAWAPESIYDDETGEYLVYASGKDLTLGDDAIDTVYVVRTRDFQSFSEPEYFVQPYNESGARVAAIDSTIIHADDGKYYQFYKKWNSQVVMMVADHASGPYTEVPTFTPIGGEGPAIYKVNGTDTYCLAIDNYSVYVPYLTNDIASGIFTKGTGEVTMSTGSKHGVMVPITQKEYDGLLAAYGAAPDNDDVLTYDFEDETDTAGLLHGGAAIVEDEEKGSKVLSLDGVDGYFQFPENIFDRRDTFTLLMDVKSNMTGNFLTFAVGSGDTEHYMFFRGRNDQLRMAGTISGWQYEHDAVNNSVGLTGEWARIALVVKPGYYAIYKDGVLVAENNNVTVTNLSKADGGGSLLTTSHLGLENLVAYLGKSFFPADAYVNGSYDNVALYNRALNAGEILKDAKGDVTDEDLVDFDIEAVTVPEEVSGDVNVIDLPTEGAYGSTITWSSSNPAYLSDNGTVLKRPSLVEGDVEVTLTATYTYGDVVEVVEYTVTLKAGHDYWVAPADWSSTHEFDPVSGKVYISFDYTPFAKADTSVGIAPASITPSGWGQYNIGFRTSATGYFQVHNNGFSGGVPYEVNKTYHVSIVADTVAQTFSCYVTDEDGNKSTVAENAVYRDKTEGALAKVNIRGGDGVAAGAFAVENFEAYSVSAEPALSIKDGEDVAELGLAYTAKISGTAEYVTDAGFEYGTYAADGGNYTVLPELTDKAFGAIDGDAFRLTINGISNANSARRYAARPYIVTYDGYKLYGDTVTATLYGALVDSIMDGAGSSILPARLAAANSIIAYVAKNKNDDSNAKFPGLEAAVNRLYVDGQLAEKAAGFGISEDESAIIEGAVTLSLEAVELEFVETDVAESETVGDITSDLDFIPEL